MGAAALGADVHPAVAALGLQMASGQVRGASARCLAMLEAMKLVVRDHVAAAAPHPGAGGHLPLGGGGPGGKGAMQQQRGLERELVKRVDRAFQFLTDCRPHSVSMGNAKSFLRQTILSLAPDLTEAEAKAEVVEEIDRFVSARIFAAGDLIAGLCGGKIRARGDVVLTFGRSRCVEQVLHRAHTVDGKRFHVVIVDARPELEGRGLLERLGAAGVSCTYAQISALAYVMPQVTKVVLGAAAIMSNGAVLGRAGTASVALQAKRRNVPVIVCCETFKLSEKVFLDSVVFNELGDPSALRRGAAAAGSAAGCGGGGGGWGGGHEPDAPSLSAAKEPKVLNVRYDLTPVKLVGMVVTEVGMIPPTAVPVLLREFRAAGGQESAMGDL